MTPESVAHKIMLLAGDESLRQALGKRAAAAINATAYTESEKVNELICGK